MVKLATPISNLFDDEHSAREIIAASDCLEARDEYTESKWPGQRLFHFKTSLIWEWDDELKRFIVRNLLTRRDLELITFHLDSCFHNPPVINKMYQPSKKLYSRKELLENAKTNTKWLRSLSGLPEKIQIGVENNNRFPTPAYDIITNGDFITQIIHQNNLQLLLDMAHARITAHHNQIPYEEYLDTLPMDKATQLHVTRPEIVQGQIARDLHEVPEDFEYEETKRLCEKHPIRYLGIEYYQDSKKLIQTLKRFQKLKTITQ